MKVVLNPKHFHVRVQPLDGTIWVTWEKHLHPITPIKDVTNDVLWALCADLNADNGLTQQVTRSIKFSDGMRCKITIEMENEDGTDIQ